MEPELDSVVQIAQQAFALSEQRSRLARPAPLLVQDSDQAEEGVLALAVADLTVMARARW